MTDTYALTGRPPSTAICWSDSESLIVEFPTKAGPPYLTRFPKTITGLQQALNVLLDHPSPRTTLPASHPAVHKVNRPGTEEQRAAAAAIVRRLALKVTR